MQSQGLVGGLSLHSVGCGKELGTRCHSADHHLPPQSSQISVPAILQLTGTDHMWSKASYTRKLRSLSHAGSCSLLNPFLWTHVTATFAVPPGLAFLQYLLNGKFRHRLCARWPAGQTWALTCVQASGQQRHQARMWSARGNAHLPPGICTQHHRVSQSLNAQ